MVWRLRRRVQEHIDQHNHHGKKQKQKVLLYSDLARVKISEKKPALDGAAR
jgi:hypothetical protein